MSEEIFQSETQITVPLFCSGSQRQAPLQRIRNTRVLDVIEFHEDRGRVRFEIDEFDGAVPHGRKDSITG